MRRKKTTMTTPIKDLDYYLSLRYRIELIPDPDGWGAILPELPGCVAAGDTIEEALTLLDDAKRGWFISWLTFTILEVLILKPT